MAASSTSTFRNRIVLRLAHAIVLSMSVFAQLAPRASLGDSGPGGAATQITGSVYQDFDANGVKNTDADSAGASNDAALAGVSVTAYGANNAAAATTVSSASGAYTLTGLTAGAPYRVEFSNLPAGAYPAFHGASGSSTKASSASSVQFVTAGARNVSFGVTLPCDYCQRAPFIISNYYMNGDALAGGSAARGFAMVAVPYFASGTLTQTTVLLRGNQIGATSGLALQRATRTVFASAVLKRHVGLGPLGLGGIYSFTVQPTSGGITQTGVSPWFDIRTLEVDLGVNPRPAGVLPGAWDLPNHDAAVFDEVGKVGMGDLDISDDGGTLWSVNLFKRELIEIRIVSGARTPTAADLTHHPLPAVACNNGVLRPWAAKFYREKIYVGAVCTGENGGAATDLTAHIFSHDAAGAPGSFTTVLTFPLNYPRSDVSPGASARWRPWISDWYQQTPTQNGGAYLQSIHPQPILMDIEFDTAGDMYLGMFDRFGHQAGSRNHGTRPTDSTLYDAASGGDLLKACKSNTTFVLESNASCGGLSTAGANTGAGPGGGEYFQGDFWSNSHTEILMGGLALLSGSGEIVSTAYDPGRDARTSGLVWMNNRTGAKNRGYEVTGTDYVAPSVTMGNAAGLGDIELMCDAAPVEIGNRIWRDDDDDGLQDSDEIGIAGVRVELVDDKTTAVLSSTLSAADGSYYFNLSAIDPVMALSSGHALTLRIALNDAGLPANHAVTVQDADGVDDNAEAGDRRDSDADNVSAKTGGAGYTSISYRTGGEGANNHTLDFGFGNASALGNSIWMDDNRDGVQNEPLTNGVNGVTVKLVNSTGAVLSTTVTRNDANGNPGYYVFERLNAGIYGVICDLATLPPQTVLTRAHAGDGSAASDALDSDVDAACATPRGQLQAAETNLTLDIGLIQPATALGNTIWRDDNRDGLQNESPANGVNGVTLKLLNDSGAVISSTVTANDANGNPGFYRFGGLNAGTYVVMCDLATLPIGSQLTGINASDDALDSDADETCTIPPVMLQPGESNLTLDIGIAARPASLGNTIWRDDNRDGVQNEAPANGINGVTVKLLNAAGALLTSTVTANDVHGNPGYYTFGLLNPGTYAVMCDVSTLPAQTQPTLQNSGDGSSAADAVDSDVDSICMTQRVTLAAGESNPTLDIGVVEALARLGNYVWIDGNADGQQASTELPAAGITVTLFLDGNPVDTVVTNSGGFYVFNNLLPRHSYRVCFERPAEMFWTRPGSLLESDTDSNVQSDGCAPVVVLSAGQYNQTLDAGLIPPVRVDPTAITLAYFGARQTGAGVSLHWITTLERNSAGFNLLRSPTAASAEFTRLNTGLIPARAADGAAYAFVAASADGGGYYWLQEIELDGTATLYGPIEPGAQSLGVNTRMTYLPFAVR